MSEETQLVLVECVSMFRMRYLVEVPVGIDDYGNDKKDWALDTVSMEEATEFSQKHIGETIVSSRVISKEEALVLCDQDNDYARNWSEEQKIEQFFTMKEEHIESV
jgi:bifunctional ADP-heptose synthase (sugar kinase/adenylyltransferase)